MSHDEHPSAPSGANCPGIVHAMRELEKWAKRARRARLDFRRFGAVVVNTDPAHVPVIVGERSWLLQQSPEIVWPESESMDLQVWVAENGRARFMTLTELSNFVAAETARKAG